MMLKKSVRMTCTMMALTLPVWLVACGGGGGGSNGSASNNNNTTPTQNTAPKAVAGVDVTVQEQGSVTLDASSSSDTDGDALSFVWQQTQGLPTVTLSNSEVANPTFTAPSVDADTELVFEVAVSDGKVSASAIDTVTVRVLNQEGNVKQQVVTPSVSTTKVQQSAGDVNIAFNYSTLPANMPTNGLVVKMHWDSSKLDFQSLASVLKDGHLGVSEPKNDAKNADMNASTDKYVLISWADIEAGQWPSATTFPIELFSANFTPINGMGSGATQVNLSSMFAQSGFEFRSQTVSVELQ